MLKYMASKADNMSDKAFNSKNGKYKGISEGNGLSFLPIIFESTGRMHPKALEFFDSLAAHAAEVKRIDKSIIFAYMMNHMSCTLQKCIAETIISRANKLNGRLTRSASGHYSLSHAFVSSHERYCSRGHGQA